MNPLMSYPLLVGLTQSLSDIPPTCRQTSAWRLAAAVAVSITAGRISARHDMST
jgi:hypothetical protein